MSGAKITVVLNAFRRTEYLEKQINAIENQSIKPTEILVWQNAGGEIPSHLLNRAVFAQCNSNLGVWSRFAYALNANSDYICVFDDDTIPGSRWFENCIETMRTNEGLLGTRGLRFLSPGRYFPSEGVGWDAPNQNVERVDIVGHAWFFKREWLGTFWREMPPSFSSKLAGEDIHFSYALQKYLNINTYVPPHPIDNIELWGSLPEEASVIGKNAVAISMNPEAAIRFNAALQYYDSKGFELCQNSIKRIKKGGLVLGSGVSHNRKLVTFFKKYPAMFNVLKKIVMWLRSKKIHV